MLNAQCWLRVFFFFWLVFYSFSLFLSLFLSLCSGSSSFAFELNNCVYLIFFLFDDLTEERKHTRGHGFRVILNQFFLIQNIIVIAVVLLDLIFYVRVVVVVVLFFVFSVIQLARFLEHFFPFRRSHIQYRFEKLWGRCSWVETEERGKLTYVAMPYNINIQIVTK